jgi:hypothetical protein
VNADPTGIPAYGVGELRGTNTTEKARELKGRQTEITLRIEQHQKGEGDYRTTLETLISVASRAAELFERSKTEQKRELLASPMTSPFGEGPVGWKADSNVSDASVCLIFA